MFGFNYQEFLENHTKNELLDAINDDIDLYIQKNFTEKEYEDFTPEELLRTAVEQNMPEVVKTLIDKGFDAIELHTTSRQGNGTTYGRSALRMAINNYNVEMFRILIDAGADILDISEIHLRRNLIPELDHMTNKEVLAIKRELDAGSAMLQVLYDAGIRMPQAFEYKGKMSLWKCEEIDLFNAFGPIGVASTDSDPYSEGIIPFMMEYSFPLPGCRPNALCTLHHQKLCKS